MYICNSVKAEEHADTTNDTHTGTTPMRLETATPHSINEKIKSRANQIAKSKLTEQTGEVANGEH